MVYKIAVLVLIVSSLSKAATLFEDVKRLYEQGGIPNRLAVDSLWVGNCASNEAPNVIRESLLTQIEVQDSILGSRRYLLPFHTQNYVQENLQNLKVEVFETAFHPKFFFQFASFYEDNKQENAWVSEEYEVLSDSPNKNYYQGRRLLIHSVRQNYTETNRIFFTMKTESAIDKTLLKFCYFFKDRSYEYR